MTALALAYPHACQMLLHKESQLSVPGLSKNLQQVSSICTTTRTNVLELSDWAAFPDAARTSRWRDALWLGPHDQGATFRRWVQNVLKAGVHLAPSVTTWGAGGFYCLWQNFLNRVYNLLILLFVLLGAKRFIRVANALIIVDAKGFKLCCIWEIPFLGK